MRKLLALFVTSCAANPNHSAEAIAPPAPVVTSQPPARITAPAATTSATDAPNPPYMKGIHSVEFLKGSALRKEPRVDSAIVGIIRKGTHAGVQQALPGGEGCPTTGGVEGRVGAVG